MAFYHDMGELVTEMLKEFSAAGSLIRTAPTGEQWNPDTEQHETAEADA